MLLFLAGKRTITNLCLLNDPVDGVFQKNGLFSSAQSNVHGFRRFNGRIRSITSSMVGSSFILIFHLAFQCTTLVTKSIIGDGRSKFIFHICVLANGNFHHSI